jgi:predicted Fe-Mo cluster-binding NifX family protein
MAPNHANGVQATTRVAFAVWNHRIAPVFDVARQIYLVVAESGRILSHTEEKLPGDGGSGNVLRLTELGVDTLVCGAISRSMQVMVASYGIRTIPFVAGDLRQIIDGWLSGELERKLFAMPGFCSRYRMPGRRISAGGQEVQPVNKRGKDGTGMEGVRGRGRGNRGAGQSGARGARGLGRMGGSKAAGPAGDCVCPKCGHREPHRRGIPCTQERCPKCGASMARE